MGLALRLRCAAAASTHDNGEKRNVVIVSILLPIGVDLTLRSTTLRAIEVLGVCEQTVLQHVAA